MNVVYDHQIFTLLKHGGIPRYFCELASRLDDQDDVDVSILAPFYINEYLKELSPRRCDGIFVPWEFPGSGRMFGAVNRLISNYNIDRIRPDIVHHTYFSRIRPTSGVGRRVLTIFDMIHERFEADYGAGNETSIIKKTMALESDHVICISENTRRDLIDFFGIPPEKTTVIYLSSSLENDPSAPRVLKEPYLLYVGSRWGYKNFRGLLSAYAASSQLRSDFRIVCFGGGDLGKDERLALQEMNIPDKRLVYMSGDDRLLASLYTHAEVFVYPSIYEGFGIPPLEAMRCDCPVVCANTSSLPEVVGSAAITFNPRSIDEICQSIEEVVYAPETRADLIRKGRERIGDFSWEECASQTLAVYRRVLGIDSDQGSRP